MIRVNLVDQGNSRRQAFWAMLCDADGMANSETPPDSGQPEGLRQTPLRPGLSQDVAWFGY